MSVRRAGDRVHYLGDVGDRGTVVRDGSVLSVIWDTPHEGCQNLDIDPFDLRDHVPLPLTASLSGAQRKANARRAWARFRAAQAS